MYEKYGKSFDQLRNHKAQFWKDNVQLLEKQLEYARLYKKQPNRNECRICKESLDSGIPYESHGVNYRICKCCGHVNGLHVETSEFVNYIYAGNDYAKVYTTEDRKKYDARINDIYAPKVDFLIETLKREESLDREEISVFDIGAGAGYFISACDDKMISCTGVDMSPQEVEFGNAFLHKKISGQKLEVIEENDLAQKILNTTANVISAIGVIEHVKDLHTIFQSIKLNESVRYIYISVPMFGMSNILESIHPDVFNRHMGGGHTHCFDDKSIDYLCEKYGLDIIAKWRFGTDMMDLFRVFMIKSTKEMSEIIEDRFYHCLDEMQAVLDKNNFSSELHVVLKKK